MPTNHRHENVMSLSCGGVARQNVWTFSYVFANWRTNVSVIASIPVVIGGNAIVPGLAIISSVAESAKARFIRYGRFSSFARMYVEIACSVWERVAAMPSILRRVVTAQLEFPA